MMNTSEGTRTDQIEPGRGHLLALRCCLLLALTTATCSPPDGPVDFQAGQFKCDHCGMDIADLRFRGEAITKKGKVYRFDAIECMLGWSAHNRDHIHSRWVGDFAHPGAWLAFGNAFILQSSKLRSPMGAGLSAYGNPQALESSRKIHGGHQLSAKDLTDYIQAWQRDPGAAMRPRNQAAEDSVGQGTGHGRKGQVHSAKEHP